MVNRKELNRHEGKWEKIEQLIKKNKDKIRPNKKQ